MGINFFEQRPALINLEEVKFDVLGLKTLPSWSYQGLKRVLLKLSIHRHITIGDVMREMRERGVEETLKGNAIPILMEMKERFVLEDVRKTNHTLNSALLQDVQETNHPVLYVSEPLSLLGLKAIMIRGEKETIQILAGDSVLNCTPDHKIYVNDGHKTRWKRADSSIVGKTSVRLFPEIHERSVDFKKGWLAGYLAGDGCVHIRNNKTQVTITSRDVEMLDVIQEWGAELGFNLRRFKHNMGKTIFPTKLDPKYIDGVQHHVS